MLPSAGTHFVLSQKYATISVKARNLGVGSDIIDGGIALHVGVLFQNHATVFLRMRLEGHRLRNPVGIRQLLFRFEMAEFINRDNVHFLGATSDVRNLDVLQQGV